MSRALPLQRLGNWLLEKDLRVTAIAFCLMVLPVLFLPLRELSSLIMSILVALLTLSKGAKKGALLLLWLVLPVVAIIFIRQLNLTLFSPARIELMLFFQVLIVWFLACLLRQYRSWKMLLEVCVVLGLIVIAVAHMVFGGEQIFKIWQALWGMKIQFMVQQMNLPLPKNEISLMRDTLASIASGVFVYQFLFYIVAALMIGRYWQSMLFRPGGFVKEFRQTSFNYIMLVVLLAVIVLGPLLKVGFALDVLFLFFLPFTFSGLSAVYFLLTQKLKASQLTLLLLSLVGLVFMAFSMVIITCVGIIDVFAHFRQTKTTVEN